MNKNANSQIDEWLSSKTIEVTNGFLDLSSKSYSSQSKEEEKDHEEEL